ncbi:MAG: helix-turn-helix domain-containing protein [Gammaproteobacteria bacterium]
MSVIYALPPNTDEAQALAKARGERLKALRLMSGFTRNGFAKKHNLSASTIQSWEAAKAGGLTERGAERMLHLLREEGICCSIEWLLFGTGSSPQLANPQFNKLREVAAMYHLPEQTAINLELAFFRKQVRHCMEYVVTDDGMAPYYRPGDYVAGRRRSGPALAGLAGCDCIVQLKNGESLLRRVRINPRTGLFDLLCTNLKTAVLLPVLYSQDVLYAAPVIWWRRLDQA